MSRNNAGLSADRIINEALRIIDGQGLRRLTMRRLGDALQVEAMAVYHHFPLGKEALFDAIADHVTDVARPDGDAPRPLPGDDPDDGADDPEGADPAADDRPWDERLRDWAHAYRTRLLRHSGALPLLINRRPDTEAALRARDLQYGAFAEAGLTGAAVPRAAAALDSYVTGAVVHQVRAEGLPSPAPAAVDGRFPHLAAHAGAAPDHDRDFREGLDALLAALVRAA
ncbi:TetR/AcrR family transcriptional regulator [Nocardiopsis trehalosi]|uniref:TetR/AcrR family transcriptional regulator n=1 Tax=Nocardiopsis trehalosi TaxID=109329 RepID=UPI00082D4656|nr:TetR/AcrR family transcriptional regulator [Nocardiopsis trehalosi]